MPEPDALPTLSALDDAVEQEQIAFGRVGQRDLAIKTGADAQRAAEQVRRECWKSLRREYGARTPHGWPMGAQFIAAICAGLAAAASVAWRSDPADTVVAATVLSVVAALGALAVSAGSRGQPQNQGAFRPYLVVAISLGIAAGSQLSRVLTLTSWIILACAVAGIGALAAYLIARALDPRGAQEMDLSINVAFARMQPRIDAIARRMQADVLAQLTPQEQYEVPRVADHRQEHRPCGSTCRRRDHQGGAGQVGPRGGA